MHISFHFSCNDKIYVLNVRFTHILGETIQNIIEQDLSLYKKVRVLSCHFKGFDLDLDENFLNNFLSDKGVVEVESEFKEGVKDDLRNKSKNLMKGELLFKQEELGNVKESEFIGRKHKINNESDLEGSNNNIVENLNINKENKKMEEKHEGNTKDGDVEVNRSRQNKGENKNTWSIFAREKDEEIKPNICEKADKAQNEKTNKFITVKGDEIIDTQKLNNKVDKADNNVPQGNITTPAHSPLLYVQPDSPSTQINQELTLTFEARNPNEVFRIIGHSRTESSSFYLKHCKTIELEDLNTNTKIVDYNLSCKYPGVYKIKLRFKYDIQDFSYMFNGCVNLTSVEGYVNSTKGVSFSGMFSNCMILSNIKLNDFSTSKGRDFSYMFYNCRSLGNLNFLKNCDFSSSTDFTSMFYRCAKLSDFSFLRNWNVSNAKIFSGMFYGCAELKNLDDFCMWKVDKAKDFINMFGSCENLEDIKAVRGWKFINEKEFERVFIGCIKLKKKEALGTVMTV